MLNKSTFQMNVLKRLFFLLIILFNCVSCIVVVNTLEYLPTKGFESIKFKIIESDLEKPLFLAENSVLVKGDYRGEERQFWVEYRTGESGNHEVLKKRNFHSLYFYSPKGKLEVVKNFRFMKAYGNSKYARHNLYLNLDSNFTFINDKKERLLISSMNKKYQLVDVWAIQYDENYDNVERNALVPKKSTIFEIPSQGHLGFKSNYFWVNYGGKLTGENGFYMETYNREGKKTTEKYFSVSDSMSIDPNEVSFFSPYGCSFHWINQNGVFEKLNFIYPKSYGGWVTDKYVEHSGNYRDENFIKENFTFIKLTFRTDSTFFENIPICEREKVGFINKSIDDLKDVLPSPRNVFNDATYSFEDKVSLISIDRELIDFDPLVVIDGKKYYFAVVESSFEDKERLISKIQGTFVSFRRR